MTSLSVTTFVKVLLDNLGSHSQLGRFWKSQYRVYGGSKAFEKGRTMREIQNAIYTELDMLYDEAKLYLEIWMTRVAKRELQRKNNPANKERTNYYLALEFNGLAFRPRWFRVQFVKNGQRTLRLSKSLSVPKNNQYSIAQFKYAEDWELDLIEEVEEGLSIVRKKVALLMKAHQSIIGAAKIDNEPLIVSSCKERVEVTTQSIAKIKESIY